MLVAVCLCLVGAPSSSFGWGSKGHKLINRMAAESLPADMPAFLKTPEAINEIEYLGPEPDRWRSRAEPELSTEQAPDHFIDLELADKIGALPRGRYEYIADLYAYIAAHPAEAAGMRPEKVGFQPYITEEVWQRLKSAMRDYRTLSAAHEDTKPVEAAILFYAGWLGHYVADGSQPLHTTIQYNGWAGPNPNGYTTSHDIHSKFESAFVDAAVNPSDVQPLMTPLKSIGDEWDDYLAYLRHTNSLVEQVYQLDKQHAFDGTGTPEGKQFVAERLAAGASMLRDLYVAAWVKSAEPVPEWHESQASTTGTQAVASSSPAATKGEPLNLAGASAGVSAASTVKMGHGGVFPPKITSSPVTIVLGTPQGKPKYQGIDLVGLIVDANGNPQQVRVVRPLGMGLDQKAIDAVKQYRFVPAQYKGKPVPVAINIEVRFQVY